jgi:hypothetical protein
MDLKQEQKKLQVEVNKLKEEKAALIEQKLTLAKEINKPIYEAKDKADLMIVEAELQVKSIREQAMKELTDAAAARHEATELLHTAKSSTEEVKSKQAELDRAKINFDSERYALETNVKKSQMDADGLFSKAINMEKALNDIKIQLDTRESNLNKREQEWQERVNTLAKTQEETKQKLSDLSFKQGELDRIKNETEKIGEESKSNLEKNKAVLAELNTKTFALQDTQKKIRQSQEELDLLRQDMNAQFDVLEKNKADISERETSVHEKERLLEKKSREVDNKIKTLHQLREQK